MLLPCSTVPFKVSGSISYLMGGSRSFAIYSFGFGGWIVAMADTDPMTRGPKDLGFNKQSYLMDEIRFRNQLITNALDLLVWRNMASAVLNNSEDNGLLKPCMLPFFWIAKTLFNSAIFRFNAPTWLFKPCFFANSKSDTLLIQPLPGTLCYKRFCRRQRFHPLSSLRKIECNIWGGM